jgi:hypothetical protein
MTFFLPSVLLIQLRYVDGIKPCLGRLGASLGT